MNFKCKKCDYKTKSKYNYDRHLNRTNPCKNNSIICEYCEKTFTHISNFSKHKKYNCKKLKEINNNKNTSNTIIELKKKELELKIKKLELEINNTNNKIEINNITNNINIVAYGKEDMSIIDKEDLKSIFKDGSHSIQKILKLVNFNKDYPENHNIFSNNLKNDYVKLYNGETWEMHKYNTAFFLILNEKLYYLRDKFNEMVNEIDMETFTNFNNFIKDLDNCKLEPNMQDNLKLFLYNNRHYAKKTYKL